MGSRPFPRWYVTTQRPYQMPNSGVASRGHVHAKQMGVSTTACGLATDSWAKDIASRFPTGDGRECPECLRVVGLREP